MNSSKLHELMDSNLLIGLIETKVRINHFIAANQNFLQSIDFIIGISRGGLIPAALMATELNKPLVTAYIDKKDSVYLDRQVWLKDKNVLIVDDAVRTGKTLFKIIELVKYLAEPKSVSTFTLATKSSMRNKMNNHYTEYWFRDSIRFIWDVEKSS